MHKNNRLLIVEKLYNFRKFPLYILCSFKLKQCIHFHGKKVAWNLVFKFKQKQILDTRTFPLVDGIK